MKKFLYILIICLSACGMQAAEVRAIAVPDNVSAGQRVQLVISASGRNYPKIVSFPDVDNVEWIRNSISLSSSNINGVMESRSVYLFKVIKEGTAEIPPLKVSVGGKTMLTNSITVKAVSGANQVVAGSRPEGDSDSKLKDLIYGKGIIMVESREFYVGEEIPVELNIYASENLKYQFTSWPVFNMDKVIFRDYSGVNKENSRFDLPSRELENVAGQRFQRYKFRTAFRAITAGTITPAATQSCEIMLPSRQQRSDEDDFFNLMRGQSYRQIPYSINIDFPELKIKALPPPPEGIDNLGLVGSWLVDYSVSAKELKSGEPFTFKIEITGIGSLENLQTPSLNIPGFRIYPPEVDKSAASGSSRQKVEIRYVMIPLKPGQAEIDLKTTAFSTSHEAYKTYEYKHKFTIVPSETQTLTAAPLVFNSSHDLKPSSEPEIKENKPVAKSGILYLKKAETGGVAVPLYLNYLWVYILLLAAGPLLWLFSEWRHASRMKLESDPLLRRRLAAQADRARVLHELKKCNPDNIDEAINNEVVPFLNNMLALPPGTTATELADKVNDKEVAGCLHSSGAASYMPGGANMDKSELKKRICKAVKAFTVILLLALLPAVATANTKKSAATKPEVIQTSVEALTAYDRGEFNRAADYYRSRLIPEKPDPALLYNLGNCYCQLRNYPAALVCYERARLLAPNDSDITENLNYVRRKLFQPQAGEIKDPASLIIAMRDNLRPDQWLLIAALAGAAAGGILAFRRSLSFNKLSILLGIVSIAALLSIVAAATQYHNDYNPDIAVIMTDNAKLHSLPSESSGQVEAKLQSGTKVKIVESRQEWSRVRCGEADGWIKSDQILAIAPGCHLP